MCNNGTYTDGTTTSFTLISAETVKTAMQAMGTEFDAVISRNVTFSQGGWGAAISFRGTPQVSWYGWGGTGGSLVFWNPERKIAFSYVMNSVGVTAMGDRRSWRLIKSLVEAVDRLTSAEVEGINA